jgi:uncharacterized protein (TIGR02246 family)
MCTRPLSARLLLLALLAVPLAGVASDDSNIDAIRKLQTAQAAAWNKHDADAYAALFTSDGDVVNVLGWWWRGRDQIQRKLSDGFAFVFRDSRLTIADVDVRILSPTIAIAHVHWTLDGAKTPPGAPQPPREGIQLQVLTKEGHDWHIASFQNTNSFPERPFPTGSPTSN